MPKISFIVPAYNEEKNIERCLSSITRSANALSLDYEVIVSNHSSADATATIASHLGAVVVNVPRGGNVSLVRNEGVKRATGQIYIFLDADIELTNDWILGFPSLLDDLGINELQITGSLCEPPESDNYFIKNWFKKIVTKKTGYLGTAHLITTKKVFELISGFDSRLVTGEDYDFCKRAKEQGVEIKVRTEMRVYHHDYPTTVFDFIRRESWHGEGDFQSLHLFLKSKVAIIAMVFLFIHFSFVISCAFSGFNWLYIVSILLLLLFSATFKFRQLSFIELVKTLPVFYLYYVGRSISLFRVIRKQLMQILKV